MSEHDAVAIRLDHVTKRFGERAVLDDVSLAVRTSTTFCLLGRSGTGKSVTLRHIVGLVAPDTGHVIVEGKDVTSLSRRALSAARKRMGLLFQSAALFDSMSVGENVAFPLRRHLKIADKAIRERVHAKLAAVGLEREVQKMPSELSGGMRKRVGLARALILDPPILLVDEPGAGLDPITTREIDELLLEQKQAGTTLVVVTHNIPSARLIADEIAFLDNGKIVAQGTPADIDASVHPLVRAFMRMKGGG